MDFHIKIWEGLLNTLVDLSPILAIIVGFQLFVIRKPIPNLKRTLIGFAYVLAGLVLFIVGLEEALFPVGKLMAQQLTDPNFVFEKLGDITLEMQWYDYKWVYLFAASIGFATTIAEPALMAVAIKAQEVSGGAISAKGLRMAVALGVSVGITMGTYRIVTGTPLYYYIIAGYIIVVIQTVFAPKIIVGLAYDSGGVSTSTVTVPVVASLGLGLASAIPDRNPLLDGFGLIAFACLFPIIAVMGYAQISEWRAHLKKDRSGQEEK